MVQQISPRVYLHIANEAQREKAKAIQAVLIANKYISPGVQNVSGQGYIQDTLEVRYFDPDSKSKAQGILAMIRLTAQRMAASVMSFQRRMIFESPRTSKHISKCGQAKIHSNNITIYEQYAKNQLVEKMTSHSKMP
jgi:hypothetical protein